MFFPLKDDLSDPILGTGVPGISARLGRPHRAHGCEARLGGGGFKALEVPLKSTPPPGRRQSRGDPSAGPVPSQQGAPLDYLPGSGSTGASEVLRGGAAGAAVANPGLANSGASR